MSFFKDRGISPAGGGNALRIPATIRVGVTGHRELADEELVSESIVKVLTAIDGILKNTPHDYTVVSPLAEGSDRLVVNEVLKRTVTGGVEGPSLDVVLPMPEEDYCKDFQTQESKEEFRKLLKKAKSVQMVGTAASRNDSYEMAGLGVVHNCDLLVAIWDGKPLAGRGGTADIVQYARNVGRTLFWINSNDGEIKEERFEDETLESLENLDAYNSELLKDADVDRDVEWQYSFLSGHAKESGLSQKLIEPLRDFLIPHFIRADLLARRYQNRHMKAGVTMYALTAAAVAMVTIQMLFFTQYYQLIWLEVAAISLILLLLWVSNASEWHRKWIDYRFLAERLRASQFLRIAGIECKPPDPLPHLSLSHRPDDWMVRAFSWIWDRTDRAPRKVKINFESLKKFLLAAWVEDQVNYYGKTSKRHRKRHVRFTRVGELLFVLTLVVAAVHASGVVEELLPSLHEISLLLTAFAIILPAVGAAMVGIRVHREYLRNAERYGHMSRHLSAVGEQLVHAGDMETLASLLDEANEMMLRENQDWRVVLIFQKLEVP